MSRYKYLLFSLVTFAVFTSSVSAATCSYEKRAELNSEVSHIKANYEVIEIELGEKLINFQNGKLLPQWKDFNSFLEWYFKLE